LGGISLGIERARTLSAACPFLPFGDATLSGIDRLGQVLSSDDIKQSRFTLWLAEMGDETAALVGSKAARLGQLHTMGIPVPSGFCVTASAFLHFLEQVGLTEELDHIVRRVVEVDLEQALREGSRSRELILSHTLSKEIRQAILSSYDAITGGTAPRHGVAVRSSACFEDLAEATFAGQLSTFLNVKSAQGVLRAVQECWASVFNSRAIAYIRSLRTRPALLRVGVLVQLMVYAEKSGVLFTIDPVSLKDDRMIIEACYGLGSAIVGGLVNPDRFVVDKCALKVIDRTIAQKTVMITARTGSHEGTVQVSVPEAHQLEPCLTNKEITRLATLGSEIERHYRQPQDIEWAIGDGDVFILQTRPVLMHRGPGGL